MIEHIMKAVMLVEYTRVHRWHHGIPLAITIVASVG